MAPTTVEPPFDQFLATADAVARARPEVDLELAREVFLEVAARLHNGLALDGLDDPPGPRPRRAEDRTPVAGRRAARPVGPAARCREILDAAGGCLRATVVRERPRG